MIKKLFQSQVAKEEKESWLLSQNKLSFYFFYLLILFLPTQLGKHFFPNFTFVYGLRIDYLSPTIYLTDFFIFFIFIFSIGKILKKIIAKPRFVLCFIIFTLFLMFGSFLSKNSLVGYLSIVKILEFLYLGIFVYFNFKNFDKKKIAIILGIGIAFESILSLLQYLNQGSLRGLFYFFGERSFNSQTPGIANASINGKLILRSYGTFPHPNVLGGYLTLSLILFMSLKQNFNKYFLIIVLAIGAFGLIFSFSRSAIFSSVLFLIMYFTFVIFEKYKKRKVNYGFFAKLILGFFILILLIISSNTEIFQRFSGLRLSDESIIQRQNLITSSFVMIENNPVFGVGINNFINNLEPNFNNPLLLQPVHNIFLLTFSELGIIGFLIFIIIFLISLTRALLQKNFYKLAILATIIILGSLDHYLLTIQQGQILFVILIGYCISYAD